MKKQGPRKVVEDLRKESVAEHKLSEHGPTGNSQYGEQDEESFLPGPKSGWIPVAANVEGHISWEDGWKPVEYMFEGIRYFQQIPHHVPDWDRLLKDLTLLKPLRLRWNELSRFEAFDDLGCFLGIVDPGEFNATTYLYFDESWCGRKQDDLFRECTELTHRLCHYEPLRDFWQYMHTC